MGCIFETLVLYVGAIAAFILPILYFYFKLSFTYWKKRNVPYVAPNFPFGNFADYIFFRKSVGHLYEVFYKKLDGQKYGGFYVFTKPMFIFRDPNIVKNILVKDFPSFHDRGLFNDEEINPLIGHLFFLPGIKWRNRRVKLSPTFTSGKIKMMSQTLVECGIELGSVLEKSARNEEVIDIKDMVARYGTDIIASCAFGIQCNSIKNPDAEFRRWGRKIFARSIRNIVAGFLLLYFPRVLSVLRLDPIDPKVSKYFRNMFEETVNYRERNNITRKDFMQLLIQIKNEVNLEDENEVLDVNGQGNVENNSSESGMYH
jgi:cytochrome P450 family 6